MPKRIVYIPIGINMIVEVLDVSSTASGLLLSAGADGARRARVVAVGEGRLLVNGQYKPLTVVPGDIVRLKPRAGDTIDNSSKNLMVDENDLLCIEREEEDAVTAHLTMTVRPAPGIQPRTEPYQPLPRPLPAHIPIGQFPMCQNVGCYNTEEVDRVTGICDRCTRTASLR